MLSKALNWHLRSKLDYLQSTLQLPLMSVEKYVWMWDLKETSMMESVKSEVRTRKDVTEESFLIHVHLDT